MKRVPLVVALLPLAIGIAAYWLWWKTEAEAFRQQVTAFAPTPELGGFPYRIEARLAATRIVRSVGGASLDASAARVTVNRQPWRTGHVVLALDAPEADVRLAGIDSAVLSVAGPSALASVRRPGDVLERASIRFEEASLALPFAGTFTASALEMHLREVEPRTTGAASPVPPVRAEARIAGTLSRGAFAFGIDLPLFATSRAPLRTVAAWRNGGTLEVRGGRLLTAGGEAVAGFDATIAALPGGRVAISGTVDTDCPGTVRAFLTGASPPQEFRTRKTQRLPITGFGDALTVGAPVGPSGGPVRSQEPPCPALRR